MSLLILPPASLLLLISAGWLAERLGWRFGRWLSLFGLCALYVLSVPLGTHALANAVQGGRPLAPSQLNDQAGEAIVVLAGGLYHDAVEYAGDTVGLLSLARARYAAFVARETGLPVLVSGGVTNPRPGHHLTEADLLAKVLATEFQVEVRWIEKNSGNTHQNARNSARLLRADGIRRILLITHVVHMPRAKSEFERQGISVVAAGTLPFDADYDFLRNLELRNWLPTMKSLQRSHYLIYEWLGSWWYHIRLGKAAGN